MGNRIKELREKKGLSQGALGKLVRTSAQQVGRIENSRRGLGERWVRDISKALGVKPGDLFDEPPSAPTSLAPPTVSDHSVEFGTAVYIPLPVYDIRASAGFGAINADYVEPSGFQFFQQNFLKAVSRSAPSQLCLIEVAGDSMLETLHNGDHVLVDQSQRSLRREGMFVFRLDDELLVKRVTMHPVTRLVTLASDNPRYSTYEGINPDDLFVVGRVIWLGRRL